MRSIKQYIPAILTLALLLVWGGWLALHRLVAMDEGFYLMAGKLVLEGEAPYLDFFYPQTPLLPYIYAFWMKYLGVSWEAGRTLSGIVYGVLGFLVVRRVYTERGARAAVVALVLFTASGSAAGWFSTTKSYAIPALLLFLAYLNAARLPFNNRSALVAGFWIGLAANVRLYLCTPLVAVVFLAYRGSSGLGRVRAAGAVILGFGVTWLPHLYWLVQDAKSYSFNNLGYHILRGTSAVEESMLSKSTILFDLLGFAPHASGDGSQFPIALLLSTLYIYGASRRRDPIDPALAFGLIVAATNFIPNPSFIQYFCITVPFLCVTAAFGFDDLTRLLEERRRTALAITIGIVLAVLYLGDGYRRVHAYTGTGEGVPGVRGAGSESSIARVRQVSAEIEQRIEAGSVVYSQWPGYLLETSAAPYPGMENHFWIRVADQLTAEERKHYRLMSFGDIPAALADPETKLVVFDQRKQKRYAPKEQLVQNGFELATAVGKIQIYSRR